MTLYKLRAILFVLLTKLFSKILFIELPPIVSAAGIIRKDGKILFLNLSYRKGYGLPGGIMQSDEEAETALRREILEETGLTISKSTYLGSVSSRTKSLATLCLFFEVEIAGDTEDMQASREGTLHWMNPADVMDNLAYENNKIALQRYA